jgi:hypothetical protein
MKEVKHVFIPFCETKCLVHKWCSLYKKVGNVLLQPTELNGCRDFDNKKEG